MTVTKAQKGYYNIDELTETLFHVSEPYSLAEKKHTNLGTHKKETLLVNFKYNRCN